MFCASEIANIVALSQEFRMCIEPRIQNVSGFRRKGTLELLHKTDFTTYKIINNKCLKIKQLIVNED